MRLRRNRSYVEQLFDAEQQLDHSILERSVTYGWIMLSRSQSPSASSTSGDSDCLAQDQMHVAEAGPSSLSVYSAVSLTRSINSIALDNLDIGDVTVDDDGWEWVVRRCFCDRPECPGESFKQIDAKDELDVYDRGRPASR